MQTWNEIVASSFINGTELSEEVVNTEANSKKIKEALKAVAIVIKNLDTFKNVLMSYDAKYEKAKNPIDIEELKKLNAEAELRNKLIDNNFDMSLNALSAKKEWETEKQAAKRLKETLELPITV